MMRLNMGFMSRVWGRPQVFVVPADGGDYNNRGRWVPAEPQQVQAVATILPMTAYDLQFYEGGTYTTEDVKVIVDGSVRLPIGTRFQYGGATYEIREGRDYEEVAGLRRYVAKRLRAEVSP